MMNVLNNFNSIIILGVFIIALFFLVKFADMLVDNAVKLSKKWGLSEIIIGATIIALGTTIPELVTAITSALKGNGSFAIGNALGSIITNTTLIIGISALYGNVPIKKKTSEKFTFFIFTFLLLIIPTIQYKINGTQIFISQKFGFVLIFLIPIYLIFLIKQSKINRNKKNKKIKKEKIKKEKIKKEKIKKEEIKKEEIKKEEIEKNVLIILLKIFLAAFVISISASLLVSSSEILATRIGIPDFIIAATLVAFGTSLPELSTCISAVKRNHGGLAIGNIMGANILNIIMVIGTTIVLIPSGIYLSNIFYNVNFISLILILIIFAYFAYNTKIDNITKKEGIILIITYTTYLLTNLFIVF